MRKLYPPVLAVIICTLCFQSTQAQRKLNRTQHVITKPSLAGIVSPQGTTADCDTVDLATALSNWATNSYILDAVDPFDTGFLAGTNIYDDKQKANYFDLSSTSYAYISGLFVAFATANSSVPADLSKKIFFRIYEDSSGQPGNLLGTEERLLSDIKSDVDGGFISEIGFNPIALPASKKIYVSVDISNFLFPQDSISIYANGNGEDKPGKAWEQWSDTSWHSFIEVYSGYDITHTTITDSANVTLWAFPAVSATATSCSVLPVRLISFNAQRNNKDVTLIWQIADEFGMKGYEVERSDNNGTFRTVATVAALNNAKNQSYSATDKNAFTISPTVQYRLKQIDGDGTVKYSRVINVKSASSISDISFANPFNGALKMQLNLATAQSVSAYLYDIQGKLVASEKPKIYNAASNTIIMTSTANLQRGVYVLKVIAGTDQAIYKVVKQ